MTIGGLMIVGVVGLVLGLILLSPWRQAGPPRS
jgi:hypothetical protein